MTEDQARKTICPKMSGPVMDTVAGLPVLHIVNCYTSDCGCWVWEMHGDYEVMTKDGRQGHCGLIR